MKKEIEVKARVDSLNVIKEELKKLGCILSEPVTQEDSIFTDYKGLFTAIPLRTNVLRIRKAKGKIIFTLKQAQKNELDCIEKEVEVNDADELKDILTTLGYKESVRVHKTRQKTKYEKMEICLDEVKGLGSFIELEKIVEGDGDTVQNELFNFLQKLGVKKEDREMKGYDTLIWMKNNSEK